MDTFCGLSTISGQKKDLPPELLFSNCWQWNWYLKKGLGTSFLIPLMEEESKALVKVVIFLRERGVASHKQLPLESSHRNPLSTNDTGHSKLNSLGCYSSGKKFLPTIESFGLSPPSRSLCKCSLQPRFWRWVGKPVPRKKIAGEGGGRRQWQHAQRRAAPVAPTVLLSGELLR